MSKYIYLDNNITNLIFDNIVSKNKFDSTLSNVELNKKYKENINILKLNMKKKFEKENILLNYSEDKIYELIYTNIFTIYKKKYKKKPNIILSITNSKTLLLFCNKLFKNKLISLTIIKPNIYGIILLNDILKYIKSNTCIISIPYCNNVFGTINDIDNIGKYCKSENIIFHSDISNIYLENELTDKYIDLITISYKKYNLKAISLLLSNELINYLSADKLLNCLSTIENKYSFSNFKTNINLNSFLLYKIRNLNTIIKKNYNLKKIFINKLSEYINIITYEDYLKIYNCQIIDELSLIIFDYQHNMPNTLICSIYTKQNKFIIKKFIMDLNQFGINLCIPFSNNELIYIHNDSYLHNGLLYFNFNESITIIDINTIIKGFLKCIQIQYNKLFEEITNRNNKNKSSIKSINNVKKRVRFNNPEYTILTKKKTLPKKNKIIKSILLKH